MIARFSAASLGLLAFAVTALAGLLVYNPVAVTLSRSLLALVVFFFIGLLLGAVAQKVVAEHQHQRLSRLKNEQEQNVMSGNNGDAGAASAGVDAPRSST